jgi:hypothetical protein
VFQSVSFNFDATNLEKNKGHPTFKDPLEIGTHPIKETLFLLFSTNYFENSKFEIQAPFLQHQFLSLSTPKKLSTAKF